MATKDILGKSINVDEEGYLTDHSQWDKEIATALAREMNIELTDAHWKVIDFIDRDFKEKGVVPGIRRIKKVGNIPTKELYELFPDKPIKTAATISGYPKPASCV
ncbi:MAG: TusE/DsrC/DsvC family sulfur relay protein [Verrucomicrobia bacterium]|nr:TusE/DsrC/DsvC family sulfur relay protein [Verrucomicrobiota bacterium]